jgi:hypothetical protein
MTPSKATLSITLHPFEAMMIHSNFRIIFHGSFTIPDTPEATPPLIDERDSFE